MKKAILTGLVSTFILGTTMATPAVFAATKPAHTMTKKTFVLNGETVTTPFGFTAKDGSSETTYLPIWYLEQVLHKLGITDHWDGHNWKITLPSGVTPNYSNLSIGNGNSGIYLNGKLVSRPNKITDIDPSSHNATTFMPLWYLQTQVLERIGLTQTWNGTTWSITGQGGTPVGAASSDKVESTFATALGISTDTLQVPSSVGPAFTLGEVDQMYWNYVGISNADASYQPGGNVSAWATDIGLNKGLSSSGFVTTSELSQLGSNLTALKNGFYKDSNGLFHLVLQPKDEYTSYFKDASYNGKPFYPTNADVQTAITKVYSFDSSVTVKIQGSYMIATMPGYSTSSEWNLLAFANDLSFKTPIQLSLDGGKTWSSWGSYSSNSASYGGVSSAPSTIELKVPTSTGFELEFNQQVPNFADENLSDVTVTYTANALHVVRNGE